MKCKWCKKNPVYFGGYCLECRKMDVHRIDRSDSSVSVEAEVKADNGGQWIPVNKRKPRGSKEVCENKQRRFEMGTTYRVNEFDEVVPYYDGRASNSTTDRREGTEFEGQLLVEIKELKTELANLLESQVEAEVSLPIKWGYEDELPKITDKEYKKMYDRSSVIDGVRMFPYVELDNNRVYLRSN